MVETFVIDCRGVPISNRFARGPGAIAMKRFSALGGFGAIMIPATEASRDPAETFEQPGWFDRLDQPFVGIGLLWNTARAHHHQPRISKAGIRFDCASQRE